MSYLLEPDVVADVGRGECPACRASLRAGHEWLRSMIREHMTDADFLAGMESSDGRRLPPGLGAVLS